jgi:hypothetical protein
VQGNGSRWLQFECLRGVDYVSWGFLQKETVKRGRGRTVREFQFQFQTVTVCFSFEETRREGVVLRKLLTCSFVKTTPFGDHFPPKSTTRHRFGDHLIPKRPHNAVLGINISPQKPNTAPFWGPLNPQKATRRRFGD